MIATTLTGLPSSRSVADEQRKEGCAQVKWSDIENDIDLAQYLHAPLPLSDASRFRISATRERVTMLEEAARRKGSIFDEDLRQVYVPTISLPKQRILPSMSDLMVMETRFYLVPRDEDTPVYAQPGSRFRKKVSRKQQDTNDEDEKDKEATEREEGGVLDLGTIVLQKVITQMKGLRGKSRKTDKFNSNASRVAGLNKYCDFLKGNGIDGRKFADLQDNLA